MARARVGHLGRRRPPRGLAYVAGVVAVGSVWTLLLIVGVPFSLAVVIGLPARRHDGLLGRRATTPAGTPYPGERSGRPQRAGGCDRHLRLRASFSSGSSVELASRACTGGTPGRSGYPRRRRSTSSGSSTRASSPSCPARRIRRSFPFSTLPRSTSWGAPTSSPCTSSTGSSQSGSFGRSRASSQSACRTGSCGRSCCLFSSRRASASASSITEADLFLDYLFVLAAILVVLWLLDRERWRLVVATVAHVRDGAHQARRSAPRGRARCRRSRHVGSAVALRLAVHSLAASRGRGGSRTVADLVHRARRRGRGGRRGLIRRTTRASLAVACASRSTCCSRVDYWSVDRSDRDRRARRSPPSRERTQLAGVLRDARPRSSRSAEDGSPGPSRSSRSPRSSAGESHHPLHGRGGAAVCRGDPAAPRRRLARERRARRSVTGARGGSVRSRDRRRSSRRVRRGDSCQRLTAVPDPRRVRAAAVDGQPVDVVYGRSTRRVGGRAPWIECWRSGSSGPSRSLDGCGRWKVVLEGVPSLEIAREVQARGADRRPRSRHSSVASRLSRYARSR